MNGPSAGVTSQLLLLAGRARAGVPGGTLALAPSGNSLEVFLEVLRILQISSDCTFSLFSDI